MNTISSFPDNSNSVVELLQWRAQHQPARQAFTFLADGETQEIHMTYAELDLWARRIAARLQNLKAAGERVVLLYPSGLDYIAAFYGCLYAQATAVPVYPPRQNRSISRLVSILKDAQPTIALTTTPILSTLQRHFVEHPELQSLHWEATDALPDDFAECWQQIHPTRSDLAFLQYTSGSTGTPKGVMLSHGNLLHNLSLIQRYCDLNAETRGISWLPPYHDMGLIGSILQPVYTDFHIVVMSPVAFLQNPLRWLRAITRYQSTSTVGPNFAFELCTERITPEQLATLDLSSLRQVLNGAEPVNPDTLDRFAATFAPCGFRKEAFHSCYGLAEATVFVSIASDTTLVATQRFDTSALAGGCVQASTGEDQKSKRLVSCGPCTQEQRVVVVDPVTCEPCAPDRVGEIWIAGSSIAQGYWQRPEVNRDIFQAHLSSTGEGPFMRTGDLGFLYQGELFIAGRLKDLIIIRGRNLYPQDIERTVQQSHSVLSRGSGAAFSVEIAGAERLVVVQEVNRQYKQYDTQEIMQEIRRTVAREYEVEVYTVALLKPGSILKTSSGKIQRSANRQAFLEGTLDIVSQWSADTREREPRILEEQRKDQVNREQSTVLASKHEGTKPPPEMVIGWLVEQIARHAKIAARQIDIRAPFESYGLDSLAAINISGEMERWLDCRLSPTLIYDYPTIEALAYHIASEKPTAADRGEHEVLAEPIAVIGMGCRFPGASDLEQFWQLLSSGTHAISEASPERLAIHTQYDPDGTTLVPACRAGFLEQVDQFDPRFFGISPREAIQMDPQQRLLLEVAWEALEHSALSPATLAGTRTGVFIGISSNDYSRLPGEVSLSSDTYSATGNALSIAANRLSYLLDLHGPSLAVDTACSSSLVALHLACQSLRLGESEVALAGGVNLILSPHVTQLFAQAQMMAKDGLCKTFDAAADGYVRGEGCGVVVLKPYRKALQDGDAILALIRGSAMNQDGRSNGLTAPNGPAQQEVIRAALRNANVTPAQISYVEVHGTGTPLGDPIEIQALGAVLQEQRPVDTLCALGSVKTNIGHLEASSGIAGFIKVILALQHEAIPPHLHLKNLNPHIPLQTLPLTIPTKLQAWPRSDTPRLAGVSSFGFGGTNAHIILEEAPIASKTETNAVERPLHLLNLSAQSKKSLRDLALRYINCLGHAADASLADTCFTASTGRTHFSQRLSVTAATLPQLEERLQAFLDGKQVRGVRYGYVQGRQQSPLVWLFTGQGSQYPGMGRQLYETQPTFRDALWRCSEILRSYLDIPLLSLLYPAPGSPNLLHETIYTQPALFALEYSLAELWRSWGVLPGVVMGHSVGEYVAACVAGVFSLEDGLKLVAARGKLMQELTCTGQMLTIHATEAYVRQVLLPYQDQCALAAINAPELVVIAGAPEAIQAISQQLTLNGIENQALKVSHAFHSPLMEPMLDAFEGIARQVQYHAPRIPLISCVDGQVLAEAPDAHYWRTHTRQTVQFATALSRLSPSDEYIFMEMGPHPTLLALGKRCLPEECHLWLPSLKREQEDWHVLLESLSALYTGGISVDWVDFDRDYIRRRVQLPTYPFERKRYWKTTTPAKESQNGQLSTTPGDYGHPQVPMIVKKEKDRSMEKLVGTNGHTAALTTQPASAITRKEVILSTLSTMVSRLLQVTPGEVESHIPLLELGADSLVLVDAVHAVEKTFGLKLSVRLLFEELTTLDALADYIAQHALPDRFPMEQEVHSLSVAEQQQQSHIQSPLPGPLATDAQGAPDGTALEYIMEQQLTVMARLMEQQLDIFRARRVSQTTPQPPVVAASERSAPSISHPAAAPSAKNRKDTFVPFQRTRIDTFKGINEPQQRYLSAFIERYTRRTQRSKQLTQATRAALADVRGVAGFRFSIKEMLYPIMAERSQGARIWDVDGNEYIDVSMGFGVHLFGHNAPFIVEALERQLKKGIPLGPQALLAGRVAELISTLTGMERVAFMNSGTEAVMIALRLARTATHRTKIALFAGSYHGSFDGVLARMEQGGEQSSVVPMAPGVPPHMVEDILVLDYGDASALQTIQAHAHELAAVLVEPVQSRRPDLQPVAFLRQLRAVTQEAGIALIFDEMITGFRIHPGGAQAWFGVEADIATYGKIVGGGMPIGVIAGKAAYMDGVDGGVWQYGDASYPQAETTFIAGTFCKHPLAMAAACAVLEELQARGPSLQEELNQRTASLAATLNTFFKEENLPIQVVHFGSLFRFAFTGNMDLLFYHLLEKGIYIWEGRNCFLSTAHTDDDISYLVHAVKESIAEMRAGGFFPGGPSGGGQKHPGGAVNPLKLSHLAPGVSAPKTNGNGHSPSALEKLTAPLTEAQKQLWVLAQMGTDELIAYNETIAVDLRGPFRFATMQQAFQTLVERHEALRTTIGSQGDVQHILPTLTLAIPVIDFSQLPPVELQERVTAYLREESRYCFDLTHGPLIRVVVIKMAEERHMLQLTAHHIITDGWSIGILLQEACYLYSAICQGNPCSLEPPLQFTEYVRWQQQQQNTPERLADEAYWLHRFSPVPPALELPTDRARPSVKTYYGARKSCTIDRHIYERVKQLSRRQGCTPFMFLFATYAAYLYRLARQEDCVIGIPTSGRSIEGGENLVGYCVNLTPVRLLFDQNVSWREHLARVKKALLEAYEHQDSPFATLVKKLNPPRDASRSPIVSVTFNMDRHMQVPPLFGLEGSLLTPPLQYTKFDLSVNIIEINGELLVDFDYNTDLFDEATIERMLGQYQTLLQEVITRPEAPLWNLPLLTEAESQDLLFTRNATETPYPLEGCYHHYFEAQASRTPLALAVQAGEHSLTYQQLNDRTNQLAAFLSRHGATRGSIIALCMPRSLEMVVALLGILKAGCAFLPLDMAFPRERMAYMLQNAQARIVLTHSSLLQQIPLEGCLGVCLDRDWPEVEQYSRTPVKSAANGDDLAYLIYTSGSTGKPKGVLVPHSGLLNYLLWCVEAYGAAHGRGAPVQSSVAADAIFPSLFAPLLVGKAVVLLPQEQPLEALQELLQTEGGFSLMKITPSQLEVLTQRLPEQDARGWVGTLVVGAEALRGDILDFWQLHAQGTVVLNEYGPTETVVGCSIYQIPAAQFVRGAVPIGLPIANTQFYVLDGCMQPVPVGVPGELYIGGAGVAWGYLHCPEQTASVFVPDPFSSRPGARLYKTGDLVRLLPDVQANIEFIGRKDQQVKIRGYRVELGEIEACLVDHQAVESAVVMVRDGEQNNRQLVAYILPQPDSPEAADPAALKEYLQQCLPDYMVPAAYVLVEHWPLTATGKINLRALPAPERNDYNLAGTCAAPRNETERRLVRIWQQILGLPQIGIYDNFFASGGDSILALQIIARAAEAGLRLNAKDLFTHQTIADLAAIASAAGPALPLIAEQGQVSGTVPLTPIQHWFLSQEQPDPQHYNQSVLLEARHPLNLAHLTRAVNEIVKHHDVLRSSFLRTESGWQQSIAEYKGQEEIRCIDLADLSSTDLSKAIETKAGEIQASLQLERGPLFQIALFLCGPHRPQRLLLVAHHLIVDGISWRILLADLQTAYQQATDGRSVYLPPKTTSFQWWSQGLQTYVLRDELCKELAYWQDMGRIAAPLLPMDRKRGKSVVGSARTIRVALSEAETRVLLHDAPVAYRTQINDLLLTALVQAIGDWSGNARVLLALEGHGREDVLEQVDLSRTIGWFTSLFPLYLSLEGGEDTATAIKKIKEQLRRVPRHGFGYGLARYLATDQDLVASLRAIPEPQISFNYLGQFNELEDSAALFTLAREGSGQSESARNLRPYALEINGRVLGGQLSLEWTYSTTLHKASTINALAQSYQAYLQEILRHCARPENRGYTPSDFPHASVSQEQLDQLAQGKHDIADMYALSPMQQGMLFHSLYDPTFDVYVCQGAWKLQGPLQRAAFAQAWQQVLEHHAILRTAFMWCEFEQPLQVVFQNVMLPIEYLDWSDLSVENQSERLELFLAGDRARGFSLESPPLMRLTLIRLSQHCHQFIWSYHHLLLDGWSMPLVLRDVLTCYRAACHSQQASLPISRSYKSYLSWLGQQDLAAAETFWRKELQGLTGCPPLGVERSLLSQSDARAGQYSEIAWRLSPSLQDGLQQMAQCFQVTINTVLQGAWALLLRRYSGEKEAIFGVTVSGRSEMPAELESMVGLFINTLPVRVQVPDDARIETWLQQIQAHQAEVNMYAYTPLWQIRRWSQVEGQQPLFQSLFVFENYPMDASLQDIEGLAVENTVQNEQTNYPLSLIVLPGAAMLFKLGYDSQIFDDATMQRMSEQYQTLLQGMIEKSGLPLEQLPLLPADESRRIVYEWNATGRQYPAEEQRLSTLLETQADLRPEATAAMFEGSTLTYRELNNRANQVARSLQRQVSKSGARIGICLERSLDMLTCLVGVVKMGGIYVPLDPGYPENRLAFMLEDAQLDLLVTRTELLGRLPLPQTRVVCLDRDWRSIARESQANLGNFTSGADCLYMLYTSGSTGRPKGVLGTQRATLNRFHWMWQTYPFAPGEVCCQKTTLNFVDAVWEIFGPLAQGIPLVLIPQQVLTDPALFLQTLATHKVTRIVLVPSLLRTLLEYEEDLGQRLPDLKYWICSGEVLSPELVRRFRQSVPQGVLLNLYGSSEVAGDATCYECTFDDSLDRVPIGKPIANTQVYVLDEAMRPVPIGVAGEIYVGGAGLARGYFNRPDLTQAKFVPDPFSSQPGARLYKTGDRACYLPDGTLQYLGRLDHQVKLRGMRIELGEIESTLRDHPAVKDALVVLREETSDNVYLIAYVVLRDGELSTDADLQEHLSRWIPSYMIPGLFVFLDTFPLTPNGKVDRRALPAPDRMESARKAPFVAPHTPVERALADAWQQVLHIPAVGIHDNFFDVGGDSILAILLASRIHNLFQVDLPLRSFFETNTATIASIASYIESTRSKIEEEEKHITQILEQLESLSDEEANKYLADLVGQES